MGGGSWLCARAWEGYLRLNLLSVPVKAYSATVSGHGKIGFHLIHSKCNSRIRYKKTCPIHGEVPNDEIVSGYEVSDGKYVLVEKEELAKLKADADKAIAIDVFIRPEDLDPVVLHGPQPITWRRTVRPAGSRTPCSAKSWRTMAATPWRPWCSPAGRKSCSYGGAKVCSPSLF